MSDTECPGCCAASGELHYLGCAKEECPFCGKYLNQCGCSFRELGLDEHLAGLDEEQSQRWLLKLMKKGRIPFLAG
jgi:hypothetical protein